MLPDVLQITIKHVKDQPIFEIRTKSKSRFLRAASMEVQFRWRSFRVCLASCSLCCSSLRAMH